MAPPARQSAGWKPIAAAAQGVEAWLEGERDQIALWLPVGLGVGIGAWFGLPDRPAWAAFLLLATGGGAAASLAGRYRAGRWLGGLLLAAALGCLLAWARSERVAAPRLDRPIVVVLAGRVAAVERLPARARLRLVVALDPAPGLPARARVNLPLDQAPDGLAPGARVRLRARLLPPAPPALPGGYDWARIAWFQGLGATGRVLGRVAVTAPAPPPSGFNRWLAAARATLTSHIQAQLPGSAGGVAAAFVTGDTGAITPADADAFRRSGLAHLLSISGVHVTVAVAGAMWLALRLLALWPWLALRAPLVLIAAGVGALAGIAYTLLSGAEVPTVRSCVAALLVLAGVALGREAVTLRLVAAGALIVLLVRPEALVGPSFQLSFAAVTAIIAFHEAPWVRRRLAPEPTDRWPRRIAPELVSLVATGLLVEAALAPIAAFHFHRAGFYGALANILAIPLSTFAIMPAEALALLLDVIGLGAPGWWLTGRAIGLLLWLARTVAALPGAVAALPAMPTAAFLLMVAGGLWLALWRQAARWLGLLPFGIGALWALLTPAPDLLITGDGRHLAVRGPDGVLRLLRDRTGDYARDRLLEGAGLLGQPQPLATMPGARCSPDLCLARVAVGGRVWHLLATRSGLSVDRTALVAACGWADIAVSDRWLPAACRPRVVKLDRPVLARAGGVAIDLRRGGMTMVNQPDGHPWTARPPPLRVGARGLHVRHGGSPRVPRGPAAISIGPE